MFNNSKRIKELENKVNKLENENSNLKCKLNIELREHFNKTNLCYCYFNNNGLSLYKAVKEQIKLIFYEPNFTTYKIIQEIELKEYYTFYLHNEGIYITIRTEDLFCDKDFIRLMNQSKEYLVNICNDMSTEMFNKLSLDEIKIIKSTEIFYKILPEEFK